MLACFVPLPFTIVWASWHLKNWKNHRTSNSSPSVPDIQAGDSLQRNSLSDESKIIVDTYQAAYKENHSYWECIVEIRKFVFCSFYLIQNNIFRLVFCSLASAIVLVHHKSVYPFRHDNSNRAETFSLLLLCTACTTNAVKSIFPQLGIIVEPKPPIEQLLLQLNRLDRVFSVLLLCFIFMVEVHETLKRRISKKQS